MYLTHRYT